MIYTVLMKKNIIKWNEKKIHCCEIKVKIYYFFKDDKKICIY